MSYADALVNYLATLACESGVETTRTLAELVKIVPPADRHNLAELMQAAQVSADRPIAELIAALRNAESD
jgi:hypothetical protein